MTDQDIPLLHDDKTRLRSERGSSRSRAGENPDELKTRLKPDGRLAESGADNGLVVAGYTTIRRIGAGGFSTVYQARDAAGRDVAIKVLNENFAHSEDILERFRRAATIVEKFDHPNIVHVLGLVDAGGRPGLVMEFVQGRTLEEVVQEENGLPVDQSISIAAQMCDALAYAHKRGVIHRDVKPSNILLLPKNDHAQEGWIAKLTDFDIAKIVTETGFTHSGTQMGTPYFVAPEQWQGKHDIDGRADVFSLGVVLYYMLTGTVPQGRFGHPSDTNPDIPRRIGSVILKAVALNRDIRYPDMVALKKALVGDRVTKASQDIPFEFRLGVQAHSLDELVDQCDADWATGLQHLEDGDILIWLERVSPDLVPCVQSAIAGTGNRDEALEKTLHCIDPFLPWPVLETDPFSLNFEELAPGEQQTRTITIHNPSRGYLLGQIAETPEWITVGSEVFRCLAGESRTISIQVQVPEKAQSQAMNGALRLESNGGNASIPVSVTVGRRLLLRPDYSVGSLEELCDSAQHDWYQIRALLYNGTLADWLRQSLLLFSLANAAKDVVSREQDRDAGLFGFLADNCPDPKRCLPPRLVTRSTRVGFGKGIRQLDPVRVTIRNIGGGDLRSLKIVGRPNWAKVRIAKAGQRRVLVELAGERRKANSSVSVGVVKFSLPDDNPVPKWGSVKIGITMEVPLVLRLFEQIISWRVLVAGLLIGTAGVILAHFVGWQWVLLVVVVSVVSFAIVFYSFS